MGCHSVFGVYVCVVEALVLLHVGFCWDKGVECGVWLLDAVLACTNEHTVQDSPAARRLVL